MIIKGQISFGRILLVALLKVSGFKNV